MHTTRADVRAAGLMTDFKTFNTTRGYINDNKAVLFYSPNDDVTDLVIRTDRATFHLIPRNASERIMILIDDEQSWNQTSAETGVRLDGATQITARHLDPEGEVIRGARAEWTFEYRPNTNLTNGRALFYAFNASEVRSIPATSVACAAAADRTCYRVTSKHSTVWAVPEGRPVPWPHCAGCGHCTGPRCCTPLRRSAKRETAPVPFGNAAEPSTRDCLPPCR